MSGSDLAQFPDAITVTPLALDMLARRAQASGKKQEQLERAALTAHMLNLQRIGAALAATNGRGHYFTSLMIVGLCAGLLIVDSYLTGERQVTLMMESEWTPYLAAQGVLLPTKSDEGQKEHGDQGLDE